MRNTVVALGLGSNLVNPLENLRKALTEIKKNKFFDVISVSSIYESNAQLPDSAPVDWSKSYLNAVVLCRFSSNVKTHVGNEFLAENILKEIKEIEEKMGRNRSERWAPRLIDIDILFWNHENYGSKKVNIPHLSLYERPFAFLPLMEVWPNKELMISRELPIWVHSYIEEKPFNTQKSKKYFWPKIVGILNITKDSFSDGGRYLNSNELQQHVYKMIDEGAELIDIGAESTRPGATFVTEEEELLQLNWVLNEINSMDIRSRFSISLDCRRAGVVQRILDKYQIEFLNDVSGFSNSEMKNMLRESRLPAFVMHSLGVPPAEEITLQRAQNPCLQLLQWWQDKLEDLLNFGITLDNLIFDPGVGFGKTKMQNLYILRHLEELSQLKHSVMIGHSRKSFLSLLSKNKASNRDMETGLITKDLNLAFVQYLRVHNVESQLIALRSRLN